MLEDMAASEVSIDMVVNYRMLDYSSDTVLVTGEDDREVGKLISATTLVVREKS